MMKPSSALLSGRVFITRISCAHGCKVLVGTDNTGVLSADSAIDSWWGVGVVTLVGVAFGGCATVRLASAGVECATEIEYIMFFTHVDIPKSVRRDLQKTSLVFSDAPSRVRETRKLLVCRRSTSSPLYVAALRQVSIFLQALHVVIGHQAHVSSGLGEGRVDGLADFGGDCKDDVLETDEAGQGPGMNDDHLLTASSMLWIFSSSWARTALDTGWQF